GFSGLGGGNLPTAPGGGASKGKSRPSGDAAAGSMPGPGGTGSAGKTPFGPGAGPGTRRDTQVVPLRHISAANLAKTLQELFSDGRARIVAEQQTNSLLIQGDNDSYDIIVKLVQQLDVPPRRNQ